MLSNLSHAAAHRFTAYRQSGSFFEIGTVMHLLAAVNPVAYQVMAFLLALAGSIGAIFSIALVVWLATVVAL